MTVELYRPTVHNQDDPREVYVTCSCKEWEFFGDWDDMCIEWFAHTIDPTSNDTYTYETRADHTTHTFLSREAAAKFREVMASKRTELLEEPIEIDAS